MNPSPKQSIGNVTNAVLAQIEAARTLAVMVTGIVETLQGMPPAAVLDLTKQDDADLCDLLRLNAADYAKAAEVLTRAADIIDQRRKGIQMPPETLN